MLAVPLLCEHAEYEALARAEPAAECGTAEVSKLVDLTGVALDLSVNLKSRALIAASNL